jgi:hypothetical protein
LRFTPLNTESNASLKDETEKHENYQKIAFVDLEKYFIKLTIKVEAGTHLNKRGDTEKPYE